jgi:hypothetical protein
MRVDRDDHWPALPLPSLSDRRSIQNVVVSLEEVSKSQAVCVEEVTVQSYQLLLLREDSFEILQVACG